VSRTRPRVQVTPHRLVVVLLVREYCHYKVSVPVTPQDRTAACLLLLDLVQSPDLDLATTCSKIKEKLHLTGLVVSWARGVARLQEEGVAGVMDLVQSLDKLLTADNFPVSRTSVIGLLLRQVILTFDKLTFSEVSSVKQQLDHYYKAGRAALGNLIDYSDEVTGESFEMSLESGEESRVEEYKLPSFLPAEFRTDRSDDKDDDNDDDNDDDGPDCQVSRKQADLFIAQQVSLLQTNEAEALSPKDLQCEITRILKSNPGLPEAHFLAYLNCLRVKEVAGAVHNLYGSCSQQDEGHPPRPGIDDGSKGFRFAALNLASYHVRMNHKEEAMSAIKEAITMAQEASDHSCLQHVLSLLHRISDGSEKQRLIERCVSKCSELQLTYLTSLGLLSLASHLVTAPGLSRARVNDVLELVARSDLLNCQHSITELQAASSLVKSTVWSVYGRPGLAVTLAQLHLQQTANCGESTALALVTIILWLENQAKPAKADLLIREAEKMFVLKSSQWSQIVTDAKDRIGVRRAMAKQEWTLALTTLARMKERRVADAELMEAQVMLRQGLLVEARDKLQTIINTQAENSELRLRALVLISDVFNLSGSPAQAVQYLVEAIHMASEVRMDLLYHLAILHLANCHLLLGFPTKALSLTMTSLTFILSHGGEEDCAKAWLLAAKCVISECKDFSIAQRRVKLLEGADMVVKAKDKFSSLGDMTRVQDCLYLLARLYHSLGLSEERNMAASQYKKIEDTHPVKTRITVQCLI